jgi:hypothetical protein
VFPRTLTLRDAFDPATVAASAACLGVGLIVGGVPLGVGLVVAVVAAAAAGPVVGYVVGHAVALVAVTPLAATDLLLLESGLVALFAFPLDDPLGSDERFLVATMGLVAAGLTAALWLATESFSTTAGVLVAGGLFVAYLLHRYELVTLDLVPDATDDAPTDDRTRPRPTEDGA